MFSLPWVVLLLAAQACSSSAPTVDLQPPDRGAGEQIGPDLSADLAPPRPDGPFTLGGACQSDIDCSAGLYCDAALPDGLCTKACSEDAQCGGPRWACLGGRCLSTCNERAIVNPCRDKYVCRVDGTRSLCVVDCRVQPCGDGWICDASSGLCVDPTAGSVGAACGANIGNCDGTPNGVCISVSTFGKGFCTVPCSPFTKPCPLQLKNAQCLLGPAQAPYCGFVCDPDAPVCPHPEMSCVPLGGDLDVCLPK